MNIECTYLGVDIIIHGPGYHKCGAKIGSHYKNVLRAFVVWEHPFETSGFLGGRGLKFAIFAKG